MAMVLGQPPQGANSDLDLGAPRQQARRLGVGLAVVAGSVAVAEVASTVIGALPLIVAAVLVGMAVGNSPVGAVAGDGLAFAATTILRSGIVLLGLRLSLGDVTALGWTTLLVIATTVITTFFAVQFIGRRMGLSERLCVLVASGFSICGNSAIAAVAGVLGPSSPDQASDDGDHAGNGGRGDDDIAAAVGLVTLCGTLAIAVIPALGRALDLDSQLFGTWIGASVQDTAQVIAVASAAGPSVLAIATAVKLTRVLFLAPIVTGVSISCRRGRFGATCGSHESKRPPLVPTFVLGFAAALLLRTSGVLPEAVLDAGGTLSTYALAAGMVGLGSSVRLSGLRRLGLAPLTLGAIAWAIVGSVSLAAVHILA